MWKPERFYSQNFEDLFLWRIFRYKPIGFYVDLGAFHPVKHSVTNIFYNQGWSGINVEPVIELCNLFDQVRDRDINLPLAVVGSDAASKGKVDLWVLEGKVELTGLHSTSKPRPVSDGTDTYEFMLREAKAVSLSNILNNYCRSIEIDFLKIDVEGAELDVLLSSGFSRISDKLLPKVLVIEVTIPGTSMPSENRDLIRSFLEEVGYSRFFFDGLNDYYCLFGNREAFSDLMMPPNVNDGFKFDCGDFFDLHAEYERVRGNVLLLDESLKSFKDQLKLASKEREAANEHACRAELDLKKQHGLVSELEEKLEVRSSQLQVAKAALDEQAAKLHGLQAELTALNDQLKLASKDREAANEHAYRTELDLKKQHGLVLELEEKLEVRSSQLQVAKAALDEQANKLHGLQTELTALNDQQAAAKQGLQRLRQLCKPCVRRQSG